MYRNLWTTLLLTACMLCACNLEEKSAEPDPFCEEAKGQYEDAFGRAADYHAEPDCDSYHYCAELLTWGAVKVRFVWGARVYGCEVTEYFKVEIA